jgi:hypothetical protein
MIIIGAGSASAERAAAKSNAARCMVRLPLQVVHRRATALLSNLPA